jgi:uncharacterized protein
VIALDTNILVYAHRADSPEHDRAYDVVRALAEGRSAWAIPWPCIHEFLAVVTNHRVFTDPTPMAGALDQVEFWLESPTLATLGEPVGYWPALRGLIERGLVVGPRVHDARIAAICISHGVRELLTADRDFGRFPALEVRNPLVA